MIHSPELEVTCDGTDCDESVYLPMGWGIGGYDLNDESIERLLTGDHDWLVMGENHYCRGCKTDQT